MKNKIFLLSIFLLVLILAKPAFAQKSWINKVKHQKYKGVIHLPHYGITMNHLTKKLEGIKKQEKKDKKNKTIKISKATAKVNAEAKAVAETLHTKAFNHQLEFFAKQMMGKGEFGKYIPHSVTKQYLTKFVKHPIAMPSGHRIFMVISSSIPYHTLRRYVLTIMNNNLPVQMVLRGLIKSHGGKLIKPTLFYIEHLIHFKGKSGYYDMHIDIDPIISTKYNIKAVPALIYVKNFNPQTYTSLGEKAYVVYGDADLKYLLKIIEHKTKSKYIKEILNRFKKEQFFTN
jgi:type-F conjugative transfer system pilin assembly protein TrbC